MVCTYALKGVTMEYVKVAVDAMGGDYAPKEIVKGAVEALSESDKIRITLVGKEDQIREELKLYQYPEDRVEILSASEMIEMAEPPVKAISTKKDSSLVKAMKLVKNGEADAVVTAGSSGATLVGGQILVGKLKGIERPPLAPLLPTSKGPVLLIDCGANVDARSSWLVQFAQMGSIYMQNMIGIEKPRVALANIGAEEEKGNALAKETYQLLKELDHINFIGNIEARDIPDGAADVVVCDAFVGNMILKMYEGVAAVLLDQITAVLKSSPKTLLGAALIKSDLKATMKKFSTSTYGGAPLLGLKGLVVKAHGNAKSTAIRNALLQCAEFKEKGVNDQFVSQMNLVDRTKKEVPEETAERV